VVHPPSAADGAAAPGERRPGRGLAPGVGQLHAGKRAAGADRGGDGRPGVALFVVPEAHVLGRDASLGVTAVASAMTTPAPPDANWAR
jgi:hypothetical protein